MGLRVVDDYGTDYGTVADWLQQGSQDQPITQTPLETPDTTPQQETPQDYNNIVDNYKSQFSDIANRPQEPTPEDYRLPQEQELMTPQETVPAQVAQSNNLFSQNVAPATQQPVVEDPQNLNRPMNFSEALKKNSWWENLVNKENAAYARMGMHNERAVKPQMAYEAHGLAQQQGSQDLLEKVIKLPPEYRQHALDTMYQAEKRTGQKLIPDVVKSQLKTMSEQQYEATKMAVHEMAKDYLKVHPELANDPKAMSKFMQAIDSSPHMSVELMTKSAEFAKTIAESQLKGQEVTLNNQYLNKPATPQAPQAPQTPQAPAMSVGQRTEGNQSLVPLATKAQMYGLDPRLPAAILGTEASGQHQVSPKGASSRWQIMPGTARPYLPEYMKNYSDGQVRAALIADPDLADHVGLSILGNLQEKYGNNIRAISAAYFSGPGNVNPDGTVKNAGKSDGNLTVAQYQDRAERNFNGGQPSTGAPSTSSNVSNNPHEQKVAAIDTQLQEKQAQLAQLPPTTLFAKMRENITKDLEELHRQRTDLVKDYENSPAYKEAAAGATARGTNAVTRQTQLDVASEAERRKPYTPDELAKMRTADGKPVPPGTTHGMVSDALEAAQKAKQPAPYVEVKPIEVPQLQKLSDQRTAIDNLKSLYDKAGNEDMAKIVGSLWTNPFGSLEQWSAGTSYSKLSPEKQYEYLKFAADMAAQVVEWRHAMFGSAVSGGEEKPGKPTIPTLGNTQQQIRAKLHSLHDNTVEKYNQSIQSLRKGRYDVPEDHTPYRTIQSVRDEINGVLGTTGKK